MTCRRPCVECPWSVETPRGPALKPGPDWPKLHVDYDALERVHGDRRFRKNRVS